MYIGSVTPESKATFILNEDKTKMLEKTVTHIPGLLKIFDEILVNAIDNRQTDKKMSYVKVDVDKESGKIMVENDGRGIPVEKHEKYGIYIPELIFGQMLTSSNFDVSFYCLIEIMILIQLWCFFGAMADFLLVLTKSGS